MKFGRDAEKEEVNAAKQGFDFADAHEIFNTLMLTAEDDRFDYGEDRRLGIGSFRGRIMVVAYTEPDEETISDDLGPKSTEA